MTHVTDENENVVESYEYSPYGQTTIKDGAGSTITSSAIENPYMFTARRMDESTGLYHYRRRAYDPERGRFLQRDPLGYVDGLGLLSYCASNPILNTDPLGLMRPGHDGDIAPDQGYTGHLGGDNVDNGQDGSSSSEEDDGVPEGSDEDDTPEDTPGKPDEGAGKEPQNNDGPFEVQPIDSHIFSRILFSNTWFHVRISFDPGRWYLPVGLDFGAASLISDKILLPEVMIDEGYEDMEERSDESLSPATGTPELKKL